MAKETEIVVTLTIVKAQEYFKILVDNDFKQIFLITQLSCFDHIFI